MCPQKSLLSDLDASTIGICDAWSLLTPPRAVMKLRPQRSDPQSLQIDATPEEMHS